MAKLLNQLFFLAFYGYLIGVVVWVTYDAGVEAALELRSRPPDKEKWKFCLVFGAIGSFFFCGILAGNGVL